MTFPHLELYTHVPCATTHALCVILNIALLLHDWWDIQQNTLNSPLQTTIAYHLVTTECSGDYDQCHQHLNKPQGLIMRHCFFLVAFHLHHSNILFSFYSAEGPPTEAAEVEGTDGEGRPHTLLQHSQPTTTCVNCKCFYKHSN